MRVPYRSVLTAVSTVVAFASFCVVGSLGQANPHNKTDVLRIGVVLPFGIPGVPIEAWSPLGALATQCYNAMLWYAEKINNQTEILPNVRIQIVVANSMYDRGVTLTAAQSLSTQGIFAMAGEAISRNTVTASLVSSVNRILHCNALATTTTLSNKQDFPFAFRTLPTIANAASALLAVVRSQGVNTVSVMASDDEGWKCNGTRVECSIQNEKCHYQELCSICCWSEIIRK
ncbi:periplasmic binding protein-like I [Chytridium lagenaria]|nr:periplasmic binding protein-like I [Chytridium lagenaria]